MDSFFLGINRGKLDFDPPQGVIVRDTMWIKPADGKPLRMVLEDIVGWLSEGDAQLGGKLKELVEQNEPSYVVTPQPPKPGETNWTASGLDKFGLLPRDFKPEPGKKYRVTIEGDSHPEQRRGVYYLGVIGPIEVKKINKVNNPDKSKI
ncbi:MAG: hypothetical protein NTY61_00565 [Candidatus Parcubacteria bacterium]|nr:hypothetical protein [Candidatus Parcubacteria bacterium]